MFSLQRLLGKEDKFFTLLEASAKEAHSSAQALLKLSKSLDQPAVLDEFMRSRSKDKEITREITSAIYTTFVTALEREDIQTLSTALYKIPKIIQKFSERARLSPQLLHGVDFSTQIGLLEMAASVVLEMVQSLRAGMDLEKIKDLNDRLQNLEGEADKKMMKLYEDLFSGKYQALQVVAVKDLYELLERGVDRCRDAGNVIANIVLKNS